MSSSLLLNPATRRPFALQEPPDDPAELFVMPAGFMARIPTAAGARTVRAPASPFLGAAFAVLDVDGQAAANPITINGNGAQIDGAATAVVDGARGLAVFLYVGTEWRRIVPAFAVDSVDELVTFNFYEPVSPTTEAAIEAATAAVAVTAAAYTDAEVAAAEAATLATAEAYTDAQVAANSPATPVGYVVSAAANADYVVPASEAQYGAIQLTGARTTTRVLSFPAPSSNAAAYARWIGNLTTGGFSQNVKVVGQSGSGTGLSWNQWSLVLFLPSSVVVLKA